MRILPQEEAHPKPNKTIVYMFMAVAMLGMAFFVYNWWKCRQSKVLHETYEDDEGFKGTNMYPKNI